MCFSIKHEAEMCLSPSFLRSRAWGKASMLEVWGERDLTASKVRARGRWGSVGGKKIKCGALLPGWLQLRRKIQHCSVTQDVMERLTEPTQESKGAEWQWGGRNWSVISLSPFNGQGLRFWVVLPKHSRQLCEKSGIHRICWVCPGGGTAVASVGQTGAMQTVPGGRGSRAVRRRGTVAQEERGDKQIQAGTHRVLVADGTSSLTIYLGFPSPFSPPI